SQTLVSPSRLGVRKVQLIAQLMKMKRLVNNNNKSESFYFQHFQGCGKDAAIR
ncbi:MAG: hypothetical protein ACI854_001437, partial [Arenicella sp.]